MTDAKIHVREATSKRGDVTAIATIVPADYKRESKAATSAVERAATPNGGSWFDAWRPR